MKLSYGFLRAAIAATLLIALAATAAPARAAGTCYVNDNASGGNSGTDWFNAYTSLQSAIADSCTEIWVAAGTYKPDNAFNRSMSFALESGTAIYGGFAGTETMLSQRDWKANVTTLSGDLNGDDSGFANNGENSYHVVYANGTVDNTAVLDGFTVIGGNANGTSANSQGGGVYLTNTGATLANLTMHYNNAEYGGGVYTDNATTSTLTNMTIRDNSATYGGGLYQTVSAISLSGVTLNNNFATYGGGMMSVNQIPIVTNVTFSGNSASVNGGGLYLYGSSPIMTNVTVSANNADAFGGGLYNDGGGTPVFTNVIIANSLNGGDCVSATSISGASSNNLIEDSFDSCMLTNGSNGNIIGSDPGLGPLADNGGPTQTFVPQTGSPAIDTGTNTGCTATDQRGASRPNNSICDIGAVELSLQSGATRTVTKLADTNGQCEILSCSLREAIASAGSGNTITFDSSLSGGTIYLDLSNGLNIYVNMTIDGSTLPSKISISGDSDHNGAPDVTVFFVGYGANATLSHLIITKGFGGLYNNGVTTVNNSIFSANNIDNQDGGAIKNTTLGTLTVNNSTFTGNLASKGAAISNYNNMTIANSTFVNNGDGTTVSGGAIYTDSIAMPGLTQVITNSTFSGNTANSGSAIYSQRTQMIINSTFSGNVANSPTGYAINQNQETLNLVNTIIANSTNGDCISSAMGVNANNLVEDGGCSAAMSGDPNLGSLASNGGPTQTLSLLPGSKAIGAGDDATCAGSPVSGFDQRGIARPNGDHCDIGAYEHQDMGAPSITAFTATNATTFDIPITAFTALEDGRITGYLITESATTPALNNPGWSTVAPTEYTVTDAGSYTLYPWVMDDASNISPVYGSPQTVSVCLAPATVTSNADSGTGTLRKAIADACAGATITFDNSLSGDTIHLASTLTLSKNVTIDGASQITISGDTDSNTVGDVRVFGVGTGVTATLDSLTITQGYANEAGAIFNEGNLTITNSEISYNTSTGYSGAISSNNGSLTITDSTFYVNTALGSNQGAGAILNNGDMTITGSTFVSNTATVGSSYGGAIYNTDPDTIIANSTFSGNSSGTGGAIYTTTSMSITNSTFSDNSAINAGGLYIDGGTTNLENTIIANSTGGDCINTTIGLGTNITNLIEDGSCFPFLSGDPNLGALASNGGATQTFALLVGSKAINAGDDIICAAAPINNLDQRSNTRSGNGPHCDIGAYEYQDSSAPSVTAFAATSPSNSLNIPITNFTGSDNVGIAGYNITASATAPLAGDTGWTASAPTTYTVGGEGAYTLYPWVKDAAGNVSSVYGSPLSVTVDTTAPTVLSSVVVNPNPTNKLSVQFTVTFSESVTGVDVTDFSLIKTGVTGGSVSSVSGSSAAYTVTINTGSGNGTIRLDVNASGTGIQDAAGNTLSGSFTGGESYTVNKTLTFMSTGTQDGWVLETSELSGLGGTLDSAATTFRLGDDATKKQYRGILSFTTSSIPDNAVITGVTLKVKKQGVTGGGNPLAIFQGFFADVKTGIFSASALQTSDFQTTASKIVGPTSPALTSGWYNINLATAKTFINKLSASSGLTQIRLRFKLDDNNNAIANYLSLYSGNAPAASRPQLVVTYYVP